MNPYPEIHQSSQKDIGNESFPLIHSLVGLARLRKTSAINHQRIFLDDLVYSLKVFVVSLVDNDKE